MQKGVRGLQSDSYRGGHNRLIRKEMLTYFTGETESFACAAVLGSFAV